MIFKSSPNCLCHTLNIISIKKQEKKKRRTFATFWKQKVDGQKMIQCKYRAAYPPCSLGGKLGFTAHSENFEVKENCEILVSIKEHPEEFSLRIEKGLNWYVEIFWWLCGSKLFKLCLEITGKPPTGAQIFCACDEKFLSRR